MTPRPGVAASLAMLAALASGCAAPFSDLQGARTAGRGRVEVTGSFSSIHAAGVLGSPPGYALAPTSAEGESGELQREYTAQLAAGIGDRTDWRFRYTRIGPPGGGGGGINVFAAGPKFANARQRLAVALPVGFAFGEGVENVGQTFQFHPTVLFTVPSGRSLELNTSGKVLIPIGGGSPGLAANLGFGLSSNLDRWALRPEVGVLKYTDSDGYLYHLSLGLSYNLGR